MNNTRKGVSLVTVLLFMLVATIAGTATYKWLSSAGSTSASRMRIVEARQAAVAGLDAARSWMSYNANDVGGVIKQYLEKKQTENNPVIKLNNVLQGISNSKQKYDVYLAGVNKENATYRVKLVSVGLSENGTKYSEAAILDINGLYQVAIPSFNSASGTADFKQAFFGSFEDGISMEVSSAIINGNVKLNTTAHIDEEFVVVGDLNVNSNTQIKNLYVKGNLYSCTNLNVSNDTYVEKTLYANGENHFFGNLYVEDGVDVTSEAKPDGLQCGTATGGSLLVDGNLTSNGSVYLPKHTTPYPIKVGGSLVVNGGQLVFPKIADYKTHDQSYTFKVDENVSVSGGFNDGSHLGYPAAENISFGHSGNTIYLGSTTLYQVSDDNRNSTYSHWHNHGVSTSLKSGGAPGTVYAYNASNNIFELEIRPLAANVYCDASDCAPTAYSGSGVGDGAYFRDNEAFYGPAQWGFVNWEWKYYYNTMRDEIFVQVNGNIVSTAPNTTSWLANRMTEYETRIETNNTGDGCGTKEHIRDPLKFNKKLLTSDLIHSATHPLSCSSDNGFNFYGDWPNDPWNQLNNCYAEAAKPENNELYDGSWLIVRLSGLAWPNGSTLRGNYIIIVDDRKSNIQSIALPSTEKTSNVILYFPDGYSGGIKTQGTGTEYNYFIYSDGDISKPNGFQLAGDAITGSIYMSDCHKAYSSNIVKVKYNEDLVSALQSSAIVCNNDGDASSGCSKSSGGSTPSSTGGSSSTSEDGVELDPFYIATAPQLSMTMVSQYKNDEIKLEKMSSSNVEPSVIVLPRIIRLNKDPDGRLSDYYTIVPLNGALESEISANNVSCPSAIPTSGLLYDGENPLEKDVYTCNYTYNNKQIPFYVVVDGVKGEKPTVTFEEPENQEIEADGQVTVSLLAPKGNREVKVQVSAPSLSMLTSRGWSYTPQGQYSKISDNGVTSIYSFTVPLSGSSDPIPLFVVETATSAAQADATFQLTDPCEGCYIGSPFVKRVFLKGHVSVKRQNLDVYCSDDEKASAFKTAFNEDCSTVYNRPDCGSLMQGFSWVNVTGQECNIKVQNDEWQCNTGLPISLRKTPLTNDFCQVFVPEETLTNLEISKEYPLPAAAKRKPAQLTVKLVKAGTAGSGNVTVKYKRPGSSTDGYVEWTGSPCRTSSCTIDFFAGDTVLLEGIDGSDHFNYWTCSGRNCNEKEGVYVPSPVYKILLTGDNTLEANFNKKDMHCTYTDFSATTAFCNSTSNDDCVDHCKTEKCSVDDPTQSATNPNSNWLLIYKNKRIDHIGADEYVWQTPEVKNNHISGAQFVGGSTNGYPTVLLNRIEAGPEGTLSAIFRVPSMAQNVWSQIAKRPSDNGFIFRSNKNATSYFTLNVVSVFEESWNWGSKVTTYHTNARVCYVNGRDASYSKCKDAPFTGSLMGSDVVTSMIEKSSISIDVRGSTVVAHLSFNVAGTSFGSAYATIELDDDVFGLSKNYLNDDDHQYVGLKFDKAGIFNTQFEVFDFAWKSDKYHDQCWDTPTVSCSFKANYAGNMVPQNQEVTPWVFMSSWFTNKFNNNQCQIEYYYNGCDMPSSYYEDSRSFLNLVANDNNKNQSCAGDEPMGFYKWSANELHSYGHGLLESEKYFFEDEGLHGKAVSGGVLKEASVIISCNLEGSVKRYDAASCGPFNVGELIQCSETYSNLLESAVDCPSDGECSVAFNERINARGSSISFKVTGMVESSTIQVLVEDSQGKRSAVASEVTQSGVHSITVNDAIATDEFNPQDVAKLVFVGLATGGYEISQIQSVCPNALRLICNDPVYDADKQEWLVSAIVLNGDDATCRVSVAPGFNGDNIDIPDPISCTNNFSQSVKQEGVYGASEAKSYKFVITALDEQGNEITTENASCETGVVEVPVVNFTTCELSNVVKDGGENTIQQGKGVPSLSFEISGCPDDRCDYTVYYDNNQLAKAKGYRESGRCPNGNRCTSENTGIYYTAGSTHKYVVDAYGVRCEQEFTVSATDENITCAASIDVADGKFVANLNSSDWIGTLVFSDNLGMNPASVDVTGGTNFEYPLPEAAAGGVYQATLLVGGHECAALWNVKTDSNREPVLSMGTCGNVSDQDPSSSILVTPSSVIGCDDGECKLTISPATGDGSQNNYDGSAFYFYDANATGGTYTATVSRDGYASSSCTFTVAFEQTSTDDCHCTCPTGCDNVITSGWNPSNPYACYFTTKDYTSESDKPHIQTYGGKMVVNVNGTNYGGSNVVPGYSGTYRIWDGSHDKDAVAGGFYIQVEQGTYDSGKLFNFNGGMPNCSAGEGSGTGGSGTETSPCSCSNYCSSGCDDLKLSVDDQYNSYSKTTCIFVTKIEGINENWGMNEIKVNNKRPGYCTSESACVNGIGKVDGGYYIQVPNTRGCIVNQTYAGSENGKSCEQVQIVATGGTAPSCSGR